MPSLHRSVGRLIAWSPAAVLLVAGCTVGGGSAGGEAAGGGTGNDPADVTGSTPAPVDTSDLPRASDDGPVWTDELVLAERTAWPDDAFVSPDEDLRVDNRDDVDHHLRAWDGSFELEIGPGERGTLRTPGPGAYPYACQLHPELRGELDVGG